MKNLQSPVKIYMIIGTVITLMAVMAFSTAQLPATTSKLIVTSENEATFDFCIISKQYPNQREEFLTKTTPFEMDIKSNNCKILLKKVSGNSLVNFKLVREKGSIEANWPTTVMLVTPYSEETFGL